MIRFDILTIFPEMFASPCGCSLLKKALDKGLIEIQLHDIRTYAEDKHRMTDDAPYGGGGGMVMKVEPIDRALCSFPLLEARSPDRPADTTGRAFLPENGGRSGELSATRPCLRAL